MPGADKIGRARARGVPLVSWDGLLALSRGEEASEVAAILEFSKGFARRARKKN